MSNIIQSNSVSERLRPFGESIFTTMTRMANECQAINLSQGFPDFDGPDWLKEMAVQAIRQGPNQYAASPGNPALRQALAGKAAHDYGLQYDPDAEITVCSGATEAIAATMLGLLNPGDEVILFEPFYDSYPACVALAGAQVRCLPLQAPDYNIDMAALESLIGPRTRAILVNSPCNPNGKVFSAQELEAIAALMRRHPDLLIITDEVYEHILFAPHKHIPFATLADMRERTICISSFSKTLSMTGWKVGYVYAPRHLTLAVRSAHQFLTFCAPSPLQSAFSQVLERLPEYYLELQQGYLERRDLFMELLDQAGLKGQAPGGTYFVVTDVRAVGFEDGFEFCKYITQELKVSAIPASAFYATKDVGKSLVRFAFCKGLDTLREAGKRLQVLSERR